MLSVIACPVDSSENIRLTGKLGKRTESMTLLLGTFAQTFQWRPTTAVCRCIEDSQPVEIGEALSSECEVGRILHTARASRKSCDCRGWKPLTLVSWNKPRWPRRGSQSVLKRAGFGLAD